jgi:CBS domain-containing protein
MLVRDVMNTDVVTAEPSTPIGQVAKLMADEEVGAVVILVGGKPAGIVNPASPSIPILRFLYSCKL